jgi:hypothetical protein
MTKPGPTLLCVLLLALAPAPAAKTADESDGAPPADAVPVTGGTYLRPNVELPDGSWAYVHVTPTDMPWRVAIGRPPRPPKYGSSTQAREVAIEAMREWEAAIQPELPWFRLEFVEKDRDAPVQVKWKRRITGPYGGFGRIKWRLTDEGVRVGGEMQISTTPSRFVTLEIDEVRLLVAHEFGHVLGLGHCLDCSSAMSYSWHSQDTINVTDVDVRTFLALVEQPNGDVAGAAPGAE